MGSTCHPKEVELTEPGSLEKVCSVDPPWDSESSGKGLEELALRPGGVGTTGSEDGRRLVLGE